MYLEQRRSDCRRSPCSSCSIAISITPRRTCRPRSTTATGHAADDACRSPPGLQQGQSGRHADPASWHCIPTALPLIDQVADFADSVLGPEAVAGQRRRSGVRFSRQSASRSVRVQANPARSSRVMGLALEADIRTVPRPLPTSTAPRVRSMVRNSRSPTRSTTTTRSTNADDYKNGHHRLQERARQCACPMLPASPSPGVENEQLASPGLADTAISASS